MEETRQLNWTLKDDCLVIDNFLKPEECKSIIDYYEAAAKQWSCLSQGKLGKN